MPSPARRRFKVRDDSVDPAPLGGGVDVAVKFFGQFLVDSGEISEAALREALDLQAERNRKFGEWATFCGYLTDDQAERVNLAQRWTDRLFGELAVEFELLTPEQVSELLARQEASQIRVGEALVEIGALEADRLKVLLDLFEREQRTYAAENRVLPEALRGCPLAEVALEVLPRVSLRALNTPAKLGLDQPWEGSSEYAYGATLPVSGPGGLELALALDRGAAEAIAMALVGVPDGDSDHDWLTRGPAEFLTALVETAVSHLGEEGTGLEPGEPRTGAFPERGCAFEALFQHGRGLLIFASPA
jgi:hypothetical protein